MNKVQATSPKLLGLVIGIVIATAIVGTMLLALLVMAMPMCACGGEPTVQEQSVPDR